MANKTISQLTAKTTPADADVLPLEDTEDTKKINYSALADAILNKLTSKTYTVAGSSQTLIAAINALNSKWQNVGYASNVDADDYNSSGAFHVGISTHSPTSDVAYGILAVFAANSSYASQLFIDSTSSYVRYKASGIWGDWRKTGV